MKYSSFEAVSVISQHTSLSRPVHSGRGLRVVDPAPNRAQGKNLARYVLHLLAAALSLLILLPALSARVASAAPQDSSSCESPEPAVLLNRTVLANGLVFMTHRHTKTVKDYSRLSNLVRSYPSTILIYSFRINPARFRLRLLDSADFGREVSDVRSLTRAAGALGAVNGGFFDEKNRPLGLHIADGKLKHGFSMCGKKSAAVFLERDGRYDILSNVNYRRYYIEAAVKPRPPVRLAVQSFPLLVGNGRSMWRWRPGEGIASRTAVGITWGGNVYLVVTDTDPLNGLSLSELATFMAVTLRCKLALNLDGGTSSQLYYHDDKHNIRVAGRSMVRTAIAIFPKVKGPVSARRPRS